MDAYGCSSKNTKNRYVKLLTNNIYAQSKDTQTAEGRNHFLIGYVPVDNDDIRIRQGLPPQSLGDLCRLTATDEPDCACPEPCPSTQGQQATPQPTFGSKKNLNKCECTQWLDTVSKSYNEKYNVRENLGAFSLTAAVRGPYNECPDCQVAGLT